MSIKLAVTIAAAFLIVLLCESYGASLSSPQQSAVAAAKGVRLLNPSAIKLCRALGCGDENGIGDDESYLQKRQYDDYGHMRFGKRNPKDFDDYGHMRFGKK